MLLPNIELAIIPAEKLRDYVLNERHRDIRGKARLFAALGYSQTNWEELARDTREQHLSQDAVEIEPNDHGTRWQIDAPLRGPAGEARIRTGWIVRHDEDFPRLTTVYPAPK